MRLTWRDGAATAATAALTVIYLALAADASWAPITSVRWAAVSVLALGIGACVVGTGDSLTDAEMPPIPRFLGAVAGLSVLGAIIFGYSPLIGVCVAASLLLWVLATVRHLRRRPPVVQSASAHERPLASAGRRS
jgi:hypothetical protein